MSLLYSNALIVANGKRPHMATFGICFMSHKWNFSMDDKIE